MSNCSCEDIIIKMSEEGVDGTGIVSVELLSEAGLVKTYRITFTNGTHFDYTATDGSSIASITKTNTEGLVDTYTVTLTDGSSTTFLVTNGNGIASIVKTGSTGLVDSYRITFTDGTIYDYTVTNGAKGDPGDTGNGIVIIEKTGTEGLDDTYTILFTDGTTTTYTVTNGNGIASIAKTGTVGLVDSYRITFTNGSHYDYTVKNGEKGDTGNGIASIELTSTVGKVDTYTITFTDGSTFTYEITNGEDSNTYNRYGVSGIGLQTAALTRLYDAVGMVAEVGTDDPTVPVQNDFDAAEPFMHRKCVGNWVLGADGYPKFNVQAYYGEGGYTEDGSKGDYVAVELPRSYYYLKNSTLIISSYKYPEYKCFDIFCRNHDQNNTLEKVYVPAYALTLDANGKAVCLPGLDNEQGDYATLFKAARKYSNPDVAAKGMIMPAALQFYYWALLNVEFATQNAQAIMRSCSSLRHNANDRVTFFDATHLLTGDYQVARVPGERIAVIDMSISSIDNYSYKATHEILSVIRCDDQGNEDAAGTHQLLEVRDLGRGYWTYDTTGETEYKLGARPYPSGACNSVVTPSGSPVSNADGYHPMRYRYRENVYGNQFHTAVDLFNLMVGTYQSGNEYLEWYYLPDPSVIETITNPGAADLVASPYEKLSLKVDPGFVSGYIVEKQYDTKYPDIWAPTISTGGGDNKYYCDYAYLVISAVARACRFGGTLNTGANDGPSTLYASNAPSAGSAHYGGDLCFPQ